MQVAAALAAEFYFVTPYHFWECGLNGHTNGLIREYFPKSMDLREVTLEDCRIVEQHLNSQPRKCLGYRAPFKVSHNLSASIPNPPSEPD